MAVMTGYAAPGKLSAFVLCRKFAEAVGAAFVLRLQNAETGNDG